MKLDIYGLGGFIASHIVFSEHQALKKLNTEYMNSRALTATITDHDGNQVNYFKAATRWLLEL